jgi:hypothetical protein
MEGDSSDDEGDRFFPDDTVEDSQSIEDIAWTQLVHDVIVTVHQPRMIVTWTAFKHDVAAEHDPYADTAPVRAG